MTISPNASPAASNRPYDFLLDAYNSGKRVLGHRCHVFLVSLSKIEPGFKARLSEAHQPDVFVEATEVSDSLSTGVTYNVRLVQGPSHWIALGLSPENLMDVLKSGFFDGLYCLPKKIAGRSYS